MSIVFTIRDFGYPFSIVKLKKIFDKNQWLSEEALREYQSSRLKEIIRHAYHKVPYYQRLFNRNGIFPDDVQTVKDLKKIPCLTRELLRNNFDALISRDAKKYKPTLVRTSGTSGGKIEFYADKPSNVLEFVYYWRYLGWAGYKPGNTIAVLSSRFFIFRKRNSKAMHHFNFLTKELTINSLFFSHEYLDELAGIFRKFKPPFLKGIPLNLYLFALLFQKRSNHGISFKAIFSQGANLAQHQRELIEKVFRTRVFDSYGHMERTVAISQCPQGSYHVHSDYGIAELDEPSLPLANESEGGTTVREVIGTSLYNFSMPLIRYRTGDFVKVKRSPEKCPCKRGFPTIISVIGREADIIITPDRKAVTGSFSVFDYTPGIIMGQIIQEKIDRLLVKIVPATADTDITDKILTYNLRKFVGTAMKIRIEHTTIDGITKDKFGKFRAAMSNIPYEHYLNHTLKTDTV